MATSHATIFDFGFPADKFIVTVSMLSPAICSARSTAARMACSAASKSITAPLRMPLD
jgi:hypothetical protein